MRFTVEDNHFINAQALYTLMKLKNLTLIFFLMF